MFPSIFLLELGINLPCTELGGYVYGSVSDLKVAYNTPCVEKNPEVPYTFSDERRPTLNSSQESFVRKWLPEMMREIYCPESSFPAVGRLTTLEDIFVVGFLFGDNWRIQLQRKLNQLMREELNFEALY